MRRTVVIVLGAGAAALAAGFLLLGAFPPSPSPHQVHQPVDVASLPAAR